MEKKETLKTVETEEKVIEVKEEPKTILKREKFKGSDGKKYYSYYVDKEVNVVTEDGEIQTKKMTANLVPKDKGGYENLETLFIINSKPSLIVRHELMVDSETKKRTKYTTYKVSGMIGEANFTIALKPFLKKFSG